MSSDISEPFIPEILSSNRIYEGDRISLRVDTLKLPNKPQHRREIVEHRGSVVIIPYLDNTYVLFVRQWRQAAGCVTLELPSGTRDMNEPPEATAERELREETGYASGSIEKIGELWVAPGYSTEYTHVYTARNLEYSPLPQDTGEDIRVQAIPDHEIPETITLGFLRDQMSIAALFLTLNPLNPLHQGPPSDILR